MTPSNVGGGYQEGYRWWLDTSGSAPTIAVIESTEEDEKRRAGRGGRGVPFGFGRALAPPPVEVDPITWEGAD